MKPSCVQATVLCLLSVVVGGSSALAQNGTISGYVSLSDNPADPVAILQSLSIEALDPVTHWWMASAQPDGATGYYEISGLTEGTAYIIHAQTHDTGYIREAWVEGGGGTYEPPLGTPVTASAVGIDLVLEPGHSISGRVYDSTGTTGLQHIFVDAGLIPWGWGRGVSTDSSGGYVIRGLADGSYQVRAQSTQDSVPVVGQQWENRSLFEDPTPLVVSGADRTGIDFSLRAGTEVRGQVARESDGAAVSNVTIEVIDVATNRWGIWAHPDGSGMYSVPLAPGAYKIRANPHQGTLIPEFWEDVHLWEQATPLVVTGDPTPITGIDFGLADGAAYGTLRGRVVRLDGTGAPHGVPGIGVGVQDYATGWDVVWTQADGDGNFSMSNVPAGTYRIRFDTEAYNLAYDRDLVTEYWNRCQETTCPPGVIDPNDYRVTYPVVPAPPGGPGADLGTFALTEGGSLSGTVCVGSIGTPCPSGPLPAGFQIEVQSSVSGGPFQAHLPWKSVSTVDGSYRFRGLPVLHAYKVQLKTQETDYVAVYYWTAEESVYDWGLATAVELTSGGEHVAGVDLHPYVGGSISGHVTCAVDGGPVDRMPITAETVSPTGPSYWGGGRTGADGSYSVRGLPSGQYRVRTDSRGEAATPGCGTLANEAYPSLVMVTEGADEPGIDFALEAGGSIRGHVHYLNEGALEPVVYIRVSASDATTGEFVSDAHTDAEGLYEIGALPQGRGYVLRVEARDSHLDPSFFNFVQEYYDDALSFEEATPVEVVDQNPVAGIDFLLELGGAISGIVADPLGSPISGAQVCANGYDFWQVDDCDVTDHNGFYIIRGLPPLDYRVGAGASSQGYASEYYDGTTNPQLAARVSVPPYSGTGPLPVTSNIDFELEPGTLLSGRVTELDGVTPIPGLEVNARTRDWSVHEGTSTDAAGEYRLVMPPGIYILEVNTRGTGYAGHEQEVDLTAGDRVVDIALAPGATISGHVYEDVDSDGLLDPGEERSGVEILAEDYDTGWRVNAGLSSPDGTYEIDSLGARRYRLRLNPDTHNFVVMFFDNVFGYNQATAVEIVTNAEGVPQDVTGNDFRVVMGTEVRGRVFFDQNDDGIHDPDEPGIGGIGVNASSPDWTFDTWGHTESDGSYTIHGVYPGPTVIRAEAQGTPYATEYFVSPRGTFRRSQAERLDGDTRDPADPVDISMVLGGGIAGTVRDEAGAPLAGIEVKADDLAWDGQWSHATTDSTGRYLLTGLAPRVAEDDYPGTYVVNAWDRSGDLVAEYFEDAFFWEDGQPVEVLARSSVDDPLATEGVDFTLEAGGAIEGYVYDATTLLPLGGIGINALERTGMQRHLFGVTTATDGTYRLPGLPVEIELMVEAAPTTTDHIRVYYDGGDDLGNPDRAQAVAPVLAPGATVPGIDFALELGGSISGIVRDENGLPLANIGVSAWSYSGGPGSGWANTDQSGHYVVHGLLPEVYRVATGWDYGGMVLYQDTTEWGAASPVQVTTGTTTGGIDFDLIATTSQPEILSGPTPATGERGTTVTGVVIEAAGLAGEPCGPTPSPPCWRIEMGGAGLALGNVGSGGGGVITFDVTIGVDAPLGARSLALVNDFAAQDGVAVLGSAFEVLAGSTPPVSGGQRLYVNDEGHSQLRVYRTSDYSLLGTIDAGCMPGTGPGSVVLSHDGSFAFVSCQDSRAVAIVDTRLGDVGEAVARLLVPGTWAVAATSRYIYASDWETGNKNLVYVIDAETWQTADTITVGTDPWVLQIDPSGQRLYVGSWTSESVAVIDVDPQSPTLNTVLATVQLPSGVHPHALAFRPDGTRAYLVTTTGTFIVDTALAEDPATAGGSLIDVRTGLPGVVEGDVGAELGDWGGQSIAVAPHAPSGKMLAYIGAWGDRVWIADVTADQAQIIHTLTGGFGTGNVVATADGGTLFLGYASSQEVIAVDTAGLLTSSAPSLTRLDSSVKPNGLAQSPGGLAIGPVPSTASAVSVEVATGSPAHNGGAPIVVTLTGGPFDAQPIVWLDGTLVRGTVTSQSATSLTVELPSMTPSGEHHVVVTNPRPGGGDSGRSTSTLEVQASADYAPRQLLYAAAHGQGEVVVFEPDGSRDSITTQPFPAHVGITPDGRLGFVAQHHAGARKTRDVLAEQHNDVAVVDLDPASATFRQVVRDIPYVGAGHETPAINPSLDDPNGVFLFEPNSLMSDTVSVVDVAACAADPTTCAEVDVDGDPATQSIPEGRFGAEKLSGITRIELDDNPTDNNARPVDAALTPDGTHLYVAVPGNSQNPGFIAVVDAVTRSLKSEIHADGTPADGGLGRAQAVDVTPAGATGPVRVYVAGEDTAGEPSLFVYETSVLGDSAFVARIALNEVPRQIAVSPGGQTVYALARLDGQILAVNVGDTFGQVQPVDDDDIAPGITDAAVAAEDRLLYVANVFRDEIAVVDIDPESPTHHQVITVLGDTKCPVGVSAQPTFAAPRIGSVSPTGGPVEGGTPVIVTGVNFAAGARVYFTDSQGGTKQTKDVTVESSFTIRATTPAGAAGPADITVTNKDGQGDTLTGRFDYQADLKPPRFVTPAHATSETTTSAEIHWKTDEPATSRVEFGTDSTLSLPPVESLELVTHHVVTLTGLASDTLHHFRATSADGSGNAASSPAPPATGTFSTLAEPDVTPPVITSGPTVSTTHDTAIVRWTTDEQSTSTVEFDALIDGVVSGSSVEGTSGTTHVVTLTGLSADTAYEYQAISADVETNTRRSAVLTFRTEETPDETPPVITSGPSASYVTNDLVIITWETNEPSTSFVNHGVSSVLEQGVIDISYATTHIVFLTNLLPGTAYGYQAGSTDAAGNTVLTADPFAESSQSLSMVRLAAPLKVGAVTLEADSLLATVPAQGGFRTAELPDTEPPEVLSLGVVVLSHDRALVQVETDEAASLLVRFGISGATESVFEPTFTQTPTLLLTGLEGSTTYLGTVRLTDPSDNAVGLALPTFTTPAAPDVDAPVISEVTVGSVTETMASVTWLTDEPADSIVHFGAQGSVLDRQTGQLGLRQSHSILLSGLEPGVTYGLQVSSRDASGNEGVAPGLPFRTLSAPPTINSLAPASVAQDDAPGDLSVAVAINGSGFDPDARVEIVEGGVSAGAWTVNGLGTQIQASFLVGDSALGPYTVRVSNPGSNPAGLSALAVLRILDATAPTIVIDEPEAGAELTSPSGVLVRGTVSEVAEVTVNGVAASVSPSAPYAFQATIDLLNPGANVITVTATDTSGNRAVRDVSVTVTQRPPVALCQDVTIAANEVCEAPVPPSAFDGGSYDPDDDPLSFVAVPAGPYPLGVTNVTLSVTDPHGATDSCKAVLTVEDATAPIIEEVVASPDVLWPPNHKMMPVVVSVTASDTCSGPVACRIVSVGSNEPIDGLGDGDSSPDWEITGDLTVDLRAERDGRGEGRVYRTTVECSDTSPASPDATATTTVAVPRNE